MATPSSSSLRGWSRTWARYIDSDPAGVELPGRRAVAEAGQEVEDAVVVGLVEVPDGEALAVRLAPRVAEDVVEVAEHPREEALGPGVEQPEGVHRRRVVVEVEGHEPDGGRAGLDEGADRVADQAEVERRVAQPGPQLGLVHRELPGLHEVRRVAVVLGRRQAGAVVEPDDIDAHAEVLDHRVGGGLQRHEPVAARHAELDRRDPREPERPRDVAGVQERPRVARVARLGPGRRARRRCG